MNIFILDKNPLKAAQYQCDCHVVKMILESGQLLATYLQLNGYEQGDMPKKTHINHPCQKWLNESPANRNWLYQHFVALLDEYTFRYDKKHLYEKYRDFYSTIFIGECEDTTPAALVMPQEYKTDDDIESYRNYYKSKNHTMKKAMKWTKRQIPDWFLLD